MTETSSQNTNDLKKVTFGLPHFITWILILATVAAFGLWGFSHLDGFSWSWDESLLIATSRAVDAGYALYEEIWYDYPPLFPFLLQLAFRLGSDPIQAARGLIVACSLLTLISAGWITRQVSHSDLASITAVLLLLLAPPFVANSRAALADLPALTLAALALATTLYGKKSKARPWFAVAGFLYSASLAMKPTSYFVILPMIVLLWTQDGDAAFPLQDLTTLVERLLFVAGGCIIGLVLFFAWVPMRAFLQQLLQTYWRTQKQYGFAFAENLQHMWFYFTGDEYGGSQYGLFSLGFFGCLAMLRKRQNPRVLAALLWLGTGLVVWLSHAPLYDHHLITLLLPLVVLAALGVVELIQMISAEFRPYFLCILGICSLWLYLLSIPALLETNMGLARPPDDDEDEDALIAAQELQYLTTSDDFIITDSLMMACRADRHVPPEMLNLSSRRIKSGQLTANKAIAWTERYEPAAIIFWNDRLESMSGYVDWVQSHYRLARWFGKERRIYLPLSPPAYSTVYTYGEELTLLGYTWESSTSRQEEPEQLTLYWRAEVQPEWDYTLEIVHLDNAGEARETIRTQLAKDDLSPSRWLEGDIIVASYDLPDGYGESVALALTREGRRIEVSNASGRQSPDNAVRLESRPYP